MYMQAKHLDTQNSKSKSKRTSFGKNVVFRLGRKKIKQVFEMILKINTRRTF